MALSQAEANNYNVNLIQSGESTNSYFTAFSNQNANANDIKDILSYLVDPTTGLRPPLVTVSDNYSVDVNNGQLGSVYMALDTSSFEGMTYVAPVGRIVSGNQGVVDAFVGVRINDVYHSMGDWHISITIIPKYIDNSRSGLYAGKGPQNIDESNRNLLADAYGLVQ